MAFPDDLIEVEATGDQMPLDFGMYEVQRRTCWYCGGGEGPFETEHQVPVSRGGKWGANVVDACASCNHLKGRLTVEEFRRALAVRLGVTEVVFAGEAGRGAQRRRSDPLPRLEPTVRSCESIRSPRTASAVQCGFYAGWAARVSLQKAPLLRRSIIGVTSSPVSTSGRTRTFRLTGVLRPSSVPGRKNKRRFCGRASCRRHRKCLCRER
jgi:hypothetical protein